MEETKKVFRIEKLKEKGVYILRILFEGKIIYEKTFKHGNDFNKKYEYFKDAIKYYYNGQCELEDLLYVIKPKD